MSDPCCYRVGMNLDLHLALTRLAALENATGSSDAPPPYALTAETWHGAGVFVTDDAFALTDSAAARAGDLGVLTRHARPLSWLFFALRELRPETLDETALFGRLADTANGFLAAHQPEENDWRPLLLAVVSEARRAVREPVRVPAQRRALFAGVGTLAAA